MSGSVLLLKRVEDALAAGLAHRLPDPGTGHAGRQVKLATPKLRHGSYFPSFPEHRRRAERALAPVVATSYLPGISTRIDALTWRVRGGGSPAVSLVRRFRVVHADTGGLTRLTASSSSFAATVAPSVRIVLATALARTRVWGFRTVLSAADRDSVVGA
jgi:hypothetical protein